MKNVNILKILILISLCISAFLTIGSSGFTTNNQQLLSKSTQFDHLLFKEIIVRMHPPIENIKLSKNVEILSINPEKGIDIIIPYVKLLSIIKMKVPYTILLNDVNAHDDSVRWDYHTLAGMETYISDIATNYPSITSLSTIGTTYEGRDIWCLEISTNPGVNQSKPGVLFMGLHHAREWPTIEICLYLANQLTSQYGVDPEITTAVNNNRIWIVPCVNPDGYYWDHDLGHDWRKNRHYFPEYDTYGVDLNRNYAGSCNGEAWGEWGSVHQGYTSNNPSNSLYCGPEPMSEMEVQAIKNLFLQNNISASISWHTHSELVCWPWAYLTSATAPDDTYMSNIGIQMASLITKQSGSGTYTPQQSASLYPTTGDTNDWMYGYSHYIIGKPLFPYLIEACTSFHPPASVLQQVIEENFDGAMYLLSEAYNISLVTPRVIPPNIFDMQNNTTGNYNITWSETNPSANPIYFQLDELSGINISTDDAESSSSLWNYDGFSLSTQQHQSGTHSYKANTQNNYISSMTSIHPLIITNNMTLNFWCWYDIEYNYDKAFVEISTNGRLYDVLDSYTGNSNGWQYKQYNLSAYVNKSIFIRFRYATDTGVSNEGFYVDDIYPLTNYDNITTLSSNIASNIYSISKNTSGTYYYRVKGYNTAHGWGDFSNLKSINVTLDYNPIIIENITAYPMIQDNTGWVNISCNAYSIYNLDFVKANITTPNGSSLNLTMSLIPGNNGYYVNATYDEEGVYSYIIWAEDFENNQKISSIHNFIIGVNVLDIAFFQGWNLITIPVQNNFNASTLIDYIPGSIMVSYFDAENQTYKSYVTGDPLPYDFMIKDGYGYFIYMNQEKTIYFLGGIITSVSVPLYVGYNMIGWYQSYNTTASGLLSAIPGALIASIFDAVNQTYKSYAAGDPPPYDFTVSKGMGIFIWTNQPSNWDGTD